MADHPIDYVFSTNREIIRYLKQTRLFGHLPDELLNKLEPLCEFASYPEGTAILQEGQENDHVFFLMRGSVVVRSAGEQILKLKRAGDIFGEMSIISNQPTSASVVSETTIDLFKIRAKDIGKFSAVDANEVQNTLFRLFATILTEKLRFTTFKAQQYEETSDRLKRTQQQLQSAYNESLREISRRVDAEKAMEEARINAESANRAKSAFLANMSHEIRTPMHGVIGLTDLLLESNLNEDQHHLTDVIKKSANALLTIIDDILDYTKIEVGGFQLHVSELDIRSLLGEVVDLLQSKTFDRKIELVSHVDSAIPDLIHCDAVRLRQVLTNLIENSIKYTEKGAISIEVKLHEQTAHSLVLLFSISDTGVGIAPEERDAIFREFYQGSSIVDERTKGSGLGLSIAKQLVELMGGQIHFDSELGKGSRFWFTIKTKRSDTELEEGDSDFRDPVTQPVLENTSEATASSDPLRILVAEDDYINQQVITLSLKKLNYESDVVTNGEEVIEILKKEDFDLVFMDIQMPKLDGFDTTRLIRNPDTGVLNPNIPVIALTAHAIKGYKEKCLKAGMNDHLSKPFKIATLDNAIRKWLPESRLPVNIPEIDLKGGSSFDQFDALKFERLREETGNEFGNLVNLYLEELPKKIGLLTRAIETNNMDELKNTAHRLKSNSAIFGATAMVTLCEELERFDTDYLVSNGDILALQLVKNSNEIQEILKQML